MIDLPILGPKIEYYGCTVCQCQHWKSEPVFQQHIYFQSKHGIRQIPLKTALKMFTALSVDLPQLNGDKVS